MSHLITVNTERDLISLVNQSDALLVYFYSDHCPPCLSLRPKIEKLMSVDFPLMRMVYVNAEEYPGLAAGYQAYSLPVLVFFFDGREFLRFSKYVSLAELKESVGRIYQLYYS